MRVQTRLLPVELSLLLLACGGTPPPASPADAANPPATIAPATPDTPVAPAAATPGAAAATPPATPAKEDDGWSGEKEAKAGDKAPSAAPGSGPSPKPGAGADKVPETRTIEVISKIVQDNRKSVRECYDKARKDLPTLQGDMTIHFVLDPEGAVKVAELNQEKSTLKSPAVVDCAVKIIKGLKFPKSSRAMETTTNYPFHFTPGG
jgi:hypothetical protein